MGFKIVRMLIGFILAANVSVMAVAEPASAEPGNSMSEYKLGVGDKISIYVFDEPDLSKDYTLSDAGTISYPFLGELRVLGLTIGNLEDRIIAGLKGSYLIDPKVNITIREYRQFYISGEVERSGGYPYQPGLTLRKAVSVAGGLKERASKDKIYVIRDGDPDKQRQLIGMDEPVFAGDTITVEQSFF